MTVVKAEGGEFGVEAGAVGAACFAVGGCRGAIKGGDPEDQTAEELEAAGACLAGAEGSARLRYFFFAASAQAG